MINAELIARVEAWITDLNQNRDLRRDISIKQAYDLSADLRALLTAAQASGCRGTITEDMEVAGAKVVKSQFVALNDHTARHIAFDVWNAMYALAPKTAAQGQEWRPIAEAPRDGKRIVIFGPVTYNDWGDEKTTVPFVHEAYFANDLWQSRGGVGHPTHWRPLPSPPNPSAAEGEWREIDKGHEPLTQTMRAELTRIKEGIAFLNSVTAQGRGYEYGLRVRDAGFAQVTQRAGGARRGRLHNLWSLEVLRPPILAALSDGALEASRQNDSQASGLNNDQP